MLNTFLPNAHRSYADYGRAAQRIAAEAGPSLYAMWDANASSDINDAFGLTDLSGNARHMRVIDGSAWPVATTDSRGRPALQFGGDSRMSPVTQKTDWNLLYDTSSDAVVFIIAEPTAGSHTVAIATDSTGIVYPQFSFRASSSTGLARWTGDTNASNNDLTTTFNRNSKFRIHKEQDRTSLRSRNDLHSKGSPDHNGRTDTWLNQGGDLVLGAFDASGTLGFEGKITAVIIINGATDETVNNVERIVNEEYLGVMDLSAIPGMVTWIKPRMDIYPGATTTFSSLWDHSGWNRLVAPTGPSPNYQFTYSGIEGRPGYTDNIPSGIYAAGSPNSAGSLTQVTDGYNPHYTSSYYWSGTFGNGAGNYYLLDSTEDGFASIRTDGGIMKFSVGGVLEISGSVPVSNNYATCRAIGDGLNSSVLIEGQSATIDSFSGSLGLDRTTRDGIMNNETTGTTRWGVPIMDFIRFDRTLSAAEDLEVRNYLRSTFGWAGI